MSGPEPPLFRPIIVDDGRGHQTTSSGSVCPGILQTTCSKRGTVQTLWLWKCLSTRNLSRIQQRKKKKNAHRLSIFLLSVELSFGERAEQTVGFSAQLDISPSHPAPPRKARTRRRQQVFADDKFWASRRHQRRSEFVCTVGIGRKCDARVGSESSGFW